MGLTDTEHAARLANVGIADRWMLDPLEHGEGDESLTLTLRQIVRVTLVATEVGARFQRDGIAADPMAWMLAPRRAFADTPPIEACVTHDDCARAVLIHGLGLDLDLERAELDALMDDEPLDDGPSGEHVKNDDANSGANSGAMLAADDYERLS